MKNGMNLSCSSLTCRHPLPVQIWDPSNPRYEVPVPLTIPATPEGNATKRLYEVKYTNSPFGIQVFRKSTGAKM